MSEQKTYTVSICGLTRHFPLLEVAPGVRIAIFNMLGDTEIVKAAAKALAERLPASGQVIVTPCPTCTGEGRVIADKTYQVDVPAGVDSGSTLRLTGRGAVGKRGGATGDLYVHLRVAPHGRYRREGDDLVTELRVSIAQAALGAKFTLPTLDGDEDIVVHGSGVPLAGPLRGGFVEAGGGGALEDVRHAAAGRRKNAEDGAAEHGAEDNGQGQAQAVGLGARQ